MTPETPEAFNERVAIELGWTQYPIRKQLWLSPDGEEHQLLPDFHAQMRTAIAEKMGWKRCPCGCDNFAPKNDEFQELVFDHDLNAMHVCELTLQGGRHDEDSEMSQYITNLTFVCADSNNPAPADVWDWDLIHATALQRCEAACRTWKIGPWKE